MKLGSAQSLSPHLRGSRATYWGVIKGVIEGRAVERPGLP